MKPWQERVAQIQMIARVEGIKIDPRTAKDFARVLASQGDGWQASTTTFYTPEKVVEMVEGWLERERDRLAVRRAS